MDALKDLLLDRVSLLVYDNIMTVQSPTIHSIVALQFVIKKLKREGIDPLFIVAALAQVQADMMEDREEW